MFCLHSCQTQGWSVVQRWSTVPLSSQRNCSFWGKTHVKHNSMTTEGVSRLRTKYMSRKFPLWMAGHLKNSWVGPFVCSLVITYIGIRPSSPVSRWASSWECWFTVFDLRDYERYLYSQYPFYLYLVERFTTGQSNIVHAWTKIEFQWQLSRKKTRNYFSPFG